MVIKQKSKNNLINRMISNKKKDYLILMAIIILLIVVILLLINGKNDGMEQAGILTTKYRVYTKEDGWSKWTKNGLTAGNKTDAIVDIQIKVNEYETPLFGFYKNNKWIEKHGKKYIMTGLRFYSMNVYEEKYSLCYRTYNKENGWLNWVCDYGEISGNINEEITAIQIKSIPNNILKYEYLRDYIKNKNDSSIGFIGVVE